MGLHPLCTHGPEAFCIKCEPFKAQPLIEQINADPAVRAYLMAERKKICGVCGKPITRTDPYRYCVRCDT